MRGRYVICVAGICVASAVACPGVRVEPPVSILDSGIDGGVDAGSDAGSDSGVDAGSDAGIDAGLDAGVDAGIDAGPDASMEWPDCGVGEPVAQNGPDPGMVLVEEGPFWQGCNPAIDTECNADESPGRCVTL